MAPRARFRLQTILSYQTRLERLLQQELAHLEHLRQQEEAELKRLHLEQEGQLTELARHHRGMLNLPIIDQGLAHLQSLAAAISRQSDRLAGLVKEVAVKRAELVDKSREKRILEKLRERQLAAQRRQEARAEERAHDELAVSRFRSSLSKGDR